MRLFGNICLRVKRLVFMLIAMLGAAWNWGNPILSGGLGVVHILAGSVWAIFHILVTLQAFIFMMLFPIYAGQVFQSLSAVIDIVSLNIFFLFFFTGVFKWKT